MSSNADFTCSFILRQHTPLLHFQHDQVGATIRPTELKAKLDKFIIAKLTECRGLEGDRFEAMVSAGKLGLLKPRPSKDSKTRKPALDYRVRVEVVQYFNPEFIEETRKAEDPNDSRKGFPCFFGNLGDEKPGATPKDIQLAFHQFVQVDFETTNRDVAAMIRKNFTEFLLRTNFGLRKSKGFGSYFLHKSQLPQPFNFTLEFGFDVDVSRKANEFDKQFEVFRVIDIFYKSLRSGLNYSYFNPENRQLYFKSMLWNYLKDQNRQWDKRTIKQFFFPANQARHEKKFEDEEDSPVNWGDGKKVKRMLNEEEKATHLLWRDLLGFATDSAWKKEYEDTLRKEFVERLPGDPKKPVFSRIPSPIFFKPIRVSTNRFRVFFEVPEALKKSYLNHVESPLPDTEFIEKWVKLTFDNQSGNQIDLPFPKGFNFDSFFKTSFDANISKYVSKGKNHEDYATLTGIYSQLKSQLPTTPNA